ncbi:hypothetical protein ACFL6I_09750 [candidate division KSB1 bacterium]
MQSKLFGIMLGVIFILIGVYLLLENYFYFYIEDTVIGLIITGIFTLFFYVQFFRNPHKYWGLILGSFSFFLAYIFFATSYYVIGEESIGVAVFWISGGTFIAAYFVNRNNWGLIIPAGVLLTLGFVVFSQLYLYGAGGFNGGFYLFLGLGATFGVLPLLGSEKQNLRWAVIPATVLFLFALLIGFFDRYSLVGELFVPTLLIAFGLVLLLRGVLFKNNHGDNRLQVQ